MLNAEQVASFRRIGFVAVQDAFSPSSIFEVRKHLDCMFAMYDSISPRRRRDLADTSVRGPEDRRSGEIDRPSALKPLLKQTDVYRTCKEIAAQLCPKPVGYSFDHAIYKAPMNQSETHWHQDQAYCGHSSSLGTIHFWIPLQEATIENGCMHFIPILEGSGLYEHERSKNGHTLSMTRVNSDAAVACPLEMGGLTIHAPLTPHYTGPNRSERVRRAWIIHFGPWGRVAKFSPRILVERVGALARDILK